MSDMAQGNRLHIAIFGRKNAGKSTLLNTLTDARTAEVSDVPGTTLEPMFIQMNLDPVGPVVLIDTAGFEENETSENAEQRGRKLREIMDQTDLALLLFIDSNEDYALERRWYKELASRHIPVLGVVNRIDDRYVDTQPIKVQFDDIPIVKISARNKVNINRLRQAVRRMAPLEFERSTIVGDLIRPRDLVLLVSPKPLKAPRYRLPVIHTQIVRDIMDQGAVSLHVSMEELPSALAYLNRKPDLVIAESDIFAAVSQSVPSDVPVTTFSILLARFKGDLDVFVKGAKAIENLRPGDRVLLAEACGNHDLRGDISRGDLPRMLKERVGGKLDFTVCTGYDFPTDLTPFKLVLHCGSCTFNRKQLMARLTRAEEQKVPISNFGVAFVYLNGMLEHVVPQVIY